MFEPDRVFMRLKVAWRKEIFGEVQELWKLFDSTSSKLNTSLSSFSPSKRGTLKNESKNIFTFIFVLKNYEQGQLKRDFGREIVKNMFVFGLLK